MREIQFIKVKTQHRSREPIVFTLCDYLKGSIKFPVD